MNAIRNAPNGAMNQVVHILERTFDSEAAVILLATALLFAADLIFLAMWYSRF